MTVQPLPRGKNTVLFNYLPYKVVYYGKGMFAMVTNWYGRAIEKINKTRLVQEMLERSAFFDSHVGFPTDVDKYIILEPSEVRVQTYPRLFVCSACGAVHGFQRPQDMTAFFEGPGHCHRTECRGRLRQYDMIHFDTSGEIDFPKPDRCPEHGFQYIVIDKKGSQSPTQWRWRCKHQNCNRELQSLGLRLPQGTVFPKPFNSVKAYIPQSFTLVNISEYDDQRIHQDLRFQYFKIAQYLGIIDQKINNYDEYKNKVDSQVSPQILDQFRKKLEDSGKDATEILNLFQENLDDSVKKFHQSIDSIPQKINIGQARLTDTCFKVMEVGQLQDSDSAMEINQIVKIAQEQENPNQNVQFFPETLKSIGISKAFVINNIPLLKTVYGYTRGEFDASETALRAFPEDRMAKGKTPIYINKIDSEGILLEFDRKKILRWLNDNHIVNINIDEMTEEEAKVWFLKEIDTGLINPFTHIDDPHRKTKHVYGLLHSMAHALISKASAQCGLDKDSLGEIIYPQIPAIVIYSNVYSEFQLGGMYTLFENAIIPWIDETVRISRECINDPICLKGKGSCFACLYLSEFSCEHFNCDLDRAYLIGSRERNIRGFWEGRL